MSITNIVEAADEIDEPLLIEVAPGEWRYIKAIHPAGGCSC